MIWFRDESLGSTDGSKLKETLSLKQIISLKFLAYIHVELFDIKLGYGSVSVCHVQIQSFNKFKILKTTWFQQNLFVNFMAAR